MIAATRYLFYNGLTAAKLGGSIKECHLWDTD